MVMEWYAATESWQVMETGELTAEGFGDGTKLYQQRARRALPVLIAQAKAGQTLFYSDLATQLGMPNPRNLNFVLGAVGGEIANLGEKWGETIPPLTCLVVNQQEELPGRGVGWFLEDTRDFKKKPLAEKRRIVAMILNDVYAYPAWDRILRHFDIPPVGLMTKRELRDASEKASSRYGFGGGEAEQHRLLKEFVACNPEAIGLPKSSKGEIEHLFPSADRLDVLFRLGSSVVGVEVKGPASDEVDLLRGLFQCVKYTALLEAEQKVLQQPVDCQILLVTALPLPAKLETIRAILGVQAVCVGYSTDTRE